MKKCTRQVCKSMFPEILDANLINMLNEYSVKILQSINKMAGTLRICIKAVSNSNRRFIKNRTRC